MDIELSETTTVMYKNIRTRGKRPMRSLPLNEKVLAIQRIHNGETKASVSRSLGVPESTLRGWCKNEIKLRRMSEQTLMLENLHDTKLPEKRKRSHERSTSMRHIKVEVTEHQEVNNNYKAAVNNNNNNNNKDIKFDDIRIKLERISKEFYGNPDNYDWNTRFMDAKIAFPEQQHEESSINDNSFEQDSETPNSTVTSSNSIPFNTELNDREAEIEGEETNYTNFTNFCDLSNNFNLQNMKFSAKDDYATMIQFCQMYVSSFNLVKNTLAEIDTMNKKEKEEKITKKRNLCSTKTNKRIYDDPYNDIRTIYESNKTFDTNISSFHNVLVKTYTDAADDFTDDDDEQPEDLSIKSTTN